MAEHEHVDEQEHEAFASAASSVCGDAAAQHDYEQFHEPEEEIAEELPAVAEDNVQQVEQQDAPQGSSTGPVEELAPEAPGTSEAPAEGQAGEVQQGQAGEVQAFVEEPEDPALVAQQEAAAEQFKAEGNQLFGEGNFLEAMGKYNAALDAAPPGSKKRAIYFGNLAACNIKLKEYTAAVANASSALQHDDTYVKALMRRSEALEKLDDLDHALKDAHRVLEIDPSVTWASATIARLTPIVAERTEKLKEEMLGKLKDLGNSILGKFGMSLDNFKMEQDPGTGSYSIKFQ